PGFRTRRRLGRPQAALPRCDPGGSRRNGVGRGGVGRAVRPDGDGIASPAGTVGGMVWLAATDEQALMLERRFVFAHRDKAMTLSDNTSSVELPTPAGDTIKVLRQAHPRARRLRLTVTPGGARVSYPQGTHPAQVFAFLRKHANWLERKLDELAFDQSQPP